MEEGGGALSSSRAHEHLHATAYVRFYLTGVEKETEAKDLPKKETDSPLSKLFMCLFEGNAEEVS